MLGGCVSAEHGIGKLKAKYLNVMMGERYLNEMAELKRAFDPKGILGRGNMFELGSKFEIRARNGRIDRRRVKLKPLFRGHLPWKSPTVPDAVRIIPNDQSTFNGLQRRHHR